MELWIIFDSGEPPCGHIELVNPSARAGEPTPRKVDPPIPFTGWLGLLRVLSDLLARPDDP